MGAMGRFLSFVGPEERDRVIGAQQWEAETLRDPFCLVQHAVGVEQYRAWNEWDRWPRSPWKAFDRAVARFGKDRIVRACKLRAARLNGSSPEAIREMTSTPAVRVGVAGV